MYLCSKVSQHERKMHLSHPLRALHKCAFGNYLVQVSKLKLLNRFLGSSRPFPIVNCFELFPAIWTFFWESIIKKKMLLQCLYNRFVEYINKNKTQLTKWKNSNSKAAQNNYLQIRTWVSKKLYYLMQLSCLFSLNLFHLTRCELFRENKF